jgi:hypothetical protein
VSSLAAAANQIMTNKINVSIAYDANAEINNLNKSMILTVSLVNPQDLGENPDVKLGRNEGSNINCDWCQIPGVVAGMWNHRSKGNKRERTRTVERMCKTQDRDMCL